MRTRSKSVLVKMAVQPSSGISTASTSSSEGFELCLVNPIRCHSEIPVSQGTERQEDHISGLSENLLPKETEQHEDCISGYSENIVPKETKQHEDCISGHSENLASKETERQQVHISGHTDKPVPLKKKRHAKHAREHSDNLGTMETGGQEDQFSGHPAETERQDLETMETEGREDQFGGRPEETERQGNDISGHYDNHVPMDVDIVPKEIDKHKGRASVKRRLFEGERCRSVEQNPREVYVNLVGVENELCLSQTKMKLCKMSGKKSKRLAKQEIPLNPVRIFSDSSITQNNKKIRVDELHESSSNCGTIHGSDQDFDTSCGPSTTKIARLDIQDHQDSDYLQARPLNTEPQTSCTYLDHSVVQESDASSDDSDLGTVENSDDCYSNISAKTPSRHEPADLGSRNISSDSKTQGQSSTCLKQCFTNIKLEKWLSYSVEDLADRMLSEKYHLQDLVDDPNSSKNTTCQLLKIIAKVSYAASSRESVADIFSLTLSASFFDRLQKLQLSFIKSPPDDLAEFYENLLTLLTSYFKVMPNVAIDRCSDLLQMILLVLPKLNGLHATHMKYSNFVETIQELEFIKKEPTKQRVYRPKDKLACLDSVEPLEDFRSISVEPTNLDINGKEKPFVRRNILRGKYKDVNTYLDVQFRLLREDFIRPLREGIAHYKNNVHTKNRSVRIYKDVQVLYSNIIDGKMTHFIKIFLPRNFRLESSKRMLYGNLLCLSADNFETCVFATVSYKNNRELKERIVGITPLPNSKVDHSAEYTIAESRTFFVAYRYVLSSLQQMSIDDVPFQEQLVRVSSDVQPPKYFANRPEVRYDLRVLLNPNHMKKTKTSGMFARANSSPHPDESSPALKEVALSIPVTDWPHHGVFGLDESQLRALHCALTKRLAIIQGPPGTGKTYLGLKIAQVLLHNSQVWSGQTEEEVLLEDDYETLYQRRHNDDEEPKNRPILVICYTNHALDQFLEGMQSFTKKIVRIGGRSLSPEIQSYQINKMVSSMIAQRKVPNHIFYSMKDLSRNLDNIKIEYNYLQAILRKLKDGAGLLRLITFEEHGIISGGILDQFSDMSPDNQPQSSSYQSWILPEDFNPPSSNDASCHERQDTNEGGQDEEDKWQDNLILISEEEKNRLQFDEMADSRANSETKSEMCFELTLKQCYTDMKALKKRSSKAEGSFRRSLASRLPETERRINCLRYVVSFDWEPYELEDGEDIHSLAFDDRCRLYASWCDQLYKKFRIRLQCLEIEYRRLTSSVDVQRTARHLHVARRADVVGVTTTGAAQHQALLRQLGPAIVIVEEAAEILEAHVLAALSTSCQHLIMIGDHQQLKPSTAVFELAKKYGLETSMFERLLNNGIAYETLQYQHRMRPEISRMLVPSVYPALLDAPGVHNALPVRGLDANVFFVAHRHVEAKDTDDNGSHSNPHEATFLAQLARYLVLQGYSQGQITILTPYSGQFFLLRKELRRISICEGIRVSIVDNFQGEENDIILLSLVRSNVTGGVGFLKSENRVCVALSRAKIGLYMIGNLEQLSRESLLWKTIRATLDSTDSAGEALLLRCQNHPLEKAVVTAAEDFLHLSPDGGCRKMCLATLPRCGHQCPRVCHVDNMDHKYDRCAMICEKVCHNDHPCPLKCWQICLPCKVPAEKTLPCGHDIQTTCRATNIKCRQKIEKVIPACKHTVLVPCYFDPRGEKCEQLCEIRLDCGHPCRLKCHADKDPDHLEYLCNAPCTRLYKDCSRDHVCKNICYLECDLCPRLLKIKAKCSHTLQVKCSDAEKKLDTCAAVVTKTLPCGHQIQAACGADPDPSLCLDVCVRSLPCGHLCGQLCGQPCATQCSHLVLTVNKCPRGHTVSLPCYLSQAPTDDDLQRFCTAPCDATLQCQHPCGGTCWGCLQGRLHRSCTQQCTRTLICGHVCQAPCSTACPPCQKPCPWRCQHSRCRLRCSQLCHPCQEPCGSYCSHKISCEQKCGEECRCEPCQRRCPKKLSCGHLCVGFCGDPCPPTCRICNKTDLSQILFGAEDEPDARFVLLPDCGHCIENEGLAKWLLSLEDGSLQMKRCPMCQQPIYNLKRFKNLILQTFKDVRMIIARSRVISSVSLADICRRVTDLQLSTSKNSALKDSALVSAVKKYDKLKRLEANCSIVAVKRNFTGKLRQMETGVDFGDQQLGLFLFQTQVLERVLIARLTLKGGLRDLMELVLTRVMEQENCAPTLGRCPCLGAYHFSDRGCSKPQHNYSRRSAKSCSGSLSSRRFHY